jgi:YHS domain-containing protein
MKPLKTLASTALLVGALAAPLISSADDAKKEKKDYPLTTCVVSGEKLGGDMGKPYVYTYKDAKVKNDSGREVRFCCKDCVKDFEKDPAKYLKKIDEAEAKAKK